MDLHTHNKWQGTWQSLDDEEYYFFAGKDTYAPHQAHLPGFWTGAEGLAHPVRDRVGNKYVLKSFTIQCPEPDRRMRWLCDHQLCNSANLVLLRGAPYKYLGPPIQAQLCPFVEGKTWDSLKTNQVRLTADQRVYLASSLVEAVRLIECGLALCHSDLSPGNMIIDLGAKGQLPRLSLIDFDAFYHASVPILPVGRGQTQGTSGYQAPEFALANDVIRTDRFALAVLIHEYLAFGEDPDLGEDHRFFEPEDLNRRTVVPTQRFKGYWGDAVFDLIRRALAAQRREDRPGPEEWCETLLTLGSPPPFGLLMTAERDGRRLRFDLQSAQIDLTAALRDPRLALQLQRTQRGYCVSNTGKGVAVLQHPLTRKHISLANTPQEIAPGCVITAAGWELTFHAKQQ